MQNYKTQVEAINPKFKDMKHSQKEWKHFIDDEKTQHDAKRLNQSSVA